MEIRHSFSKCLQQFPYYAFRHYRLKEKILEFAKIQTFRFTLIPPHSLHRDEESDTECTFCENICQFLFLSRFCAFCDSFHHSLGVAVLSLLFLYYFLYL